jgi:kumamolisin
MDRQSAIICGATLMAGASRFRVARLGTWLSLGLAFSLSSHAQTPQAAASPGIDKLTFAGSIREVATAVAQFASGASATLVRSELTQAEEKATLEFSIALKMRDFADLEERIGKGEIISLDEMVARYYPTAADYKTVADWLIAQGFAVKPADKYNLSIFASGSVAQIERAFGTKFGRVNFAGVEYSSALIEPSLPAAIAGPVLGINGLQPHLRPRPHSAIALGQPQKLTGNQPPYTIGEIAKAYSASGLGLNGSGQKIGIVIDTFPAASDLTAFWQGNGVAQSLNNIEEVQVVSGTLPSPSGEETLDVEWTSGMASGAKVRVYATTDLAFNHLDQAYQEIINELPSQPELHQISLSYGLGETYMSSAQMETDDQYFASMAGAGVSVFVSSGDGGSSPGTNGFKDNSGPVQVESPANDPNVTAVGGTSLYLNTSTGAVSSESAWFYGGGGSSQFFARPSWQHGAGVPTGATRLVPDVALVADINTGGYLIFNGQLDIVGGTSWSAPTWAAFCAMLNQVQASAGQPSSGLLGPKIYPFNGTNGFRDITTGSNGGNGTYNAGPGYDLCTGLGVPNVGTLIQDIMFEAPAGGSPKIVTIPNPPDFNGDGHQDLLWRNASTGQVGIWLMNGATATAQVVIGSPPLSWEIINTGDFDGDGKSDILWQFEDTNQYGVWFMNGTQVTGIQSFTLPSYAGQICCVADFDGDGLADLVTFDRLGGAIYFWKNTGSLRFVLQTSYPVADGSGWLPVGAARLNGAGAPPALIWRNANTGEIAAWFMSGFIWSSAASFGNPGGDVVLSGFGDFSGDGRTDLLLFNTFNNVVGYWQSNGAQEPGSVPLAQVSGTWVPVGAENLSGAGTADIIWRQTSTGALGAWQVNGSTYSIIIGSRSVGSAWQLQPQGFTP